MPVGVRRVSARMMCAQQPTRMSKACTPPSEDDEDGCWVYSETLNTITHFPPCPVCMRWHSHYIIDAAQDTESLRTAYEARDHALLDHWSEGIEGLEKERDRAVQELTELRQQLSEVRRELKQARQDRLRIVDSNDKKRQSIEANFNPTINQLHRQLENARRPT